MVLTSKAATTRACPSTSFAGPLPGSGRKALSYILQICDGARAMSFRTASSFVFAKPLGAANIFYVRIVVQAVQQVLLAWR